MSERMFTLDEYEDVKRRAYKAGLDAAREAVEQASSLLQPLGPALAAIDALRNDSSDNGTKVQDTP